jgi:hypothetical protein
VGVNNVGIETPYDRRKPVALLRPVRGAGLSNTERYERPMPQTPRVPSVRSIYYLDLREGTFLRILSTKRHDVVVYTLPLHLRNVVIDKGLGEWGERLGEMQDSQL